MVPTGVIKVSVIPNEIRRSVSLDGVGGIRRRTLSGSFICRFVVLVLVNITTIMLRSVAYMMDLLVLMIRHNTQQAQRLVRKASVLLIVYERLA